jgi:hypothetical protein
MGILAGAPTAERIPGRWRNWLSLLLASSSSSVRLNVARGPWIIHKRGLRQGDPMSPLLFIIAIDTLQYIFEKATEEGLLSPLRDRTARLRLSLYVDAVALFINPSKENADMTMEIMHHFRLATGLKINMSKSYVVPIRCSQVNLDEVL